MQEPNGFWCAIAKLITGKSCSDTPYGQFYDTALAGLTEQGRLGTEKNGARYYLTNYSDGKTFISTKVSGNDYRYWKCAENGCSQIRDTAILLWVFWNSNYCSGDSQSCLTYDGTCKTFCDSGEEPIDTLSCDYSGEVCCLSSSLSTCEGVGGVCKSGCDSGESELIVPCSDGNLCCKSSLDSYCESELGGILCGDGETCNGNNLESTDNYYGDQCCDGTCIPSGIGDDTCYALGGNTCSSTEICVDSNDWSEIQFISTKDTDRCCYSDYSLPRCVSQDTCEEMDGQVCDRDSSCSVDVEYSKDEAECCTGECLKSCSALNGFICGTAEVCSTGQYTDSSDRRCCVGKCKKETNLAWLWILLIILLLVGGFLLYWFKFRKSKDGSTKKLKNPFKDLFKKTNNQNQLKTQTPYGLPPQRTFGQYPPVQPIQPTRYPQPTKSYSPTPRINQNIILSPQPISAPQKNSLENKKTKTDLELEKTLNKLKKMTRETKKKK
jgi:hypothetical protein